ncbi:MULTISPECIES: response regulator [unclassified Mesorhizobium]|uniref:response regulator n=2 Tax=Mesorhizobium TaxID=68287 RepID=UPI0009EDA3BD|nr:MULTISPECIES: response regulator [unclassified Mesorhizobium]TGV92330.1 response regulator [Mesorhizobium sp. M00.F.Ca.ET.158.01.1.1]WIE89961.1 response regulator [Mesorhizobium sp. WSM4875]AZO58247.1 response regulator [Mesorhizobium sp. M1A.F.Ca.IN.022.06.1.1]MCT2580767.1 response regulator [Mesorhizobium sp. P13.3]MDF3169929.1 response regulator [Mesorhizobium sp. P16.1]
MPARILYVDDEDDIREIAQMSLELEPEFEVRSSASGIAALTDAADWRPDLILLDVMMPDMDGPETLRRLADSPLTAAIPVAFITARTQTHEVERYLAMGAVGVIAKPFDPLALAGEVRRLLSGRSGPV